MVKHYYIPVQNTLQTLTFGYFATVKEAENVYIKYLQEHKTFDERFAKLQVEYQEEFGKNLDIQTLQRIIFLTDDGMTNEEIEQMETEYYWLMDKGIGCSIESCKPGDLFNFDGYTEWVDFTSLYELCSCILKCKSPYTDDVSYIADQYPNEYFLKKMSEGEVQDLSVDEDREHIEDTVLIFVNGEPKSASLGVALSTFTELDPSLFAQHVFISMQKPHELTVDVGGESDHVYALDDEIDVQMSNSRLQLFFLDGGDIRNGDTVLYSSALYRVQSGSSTNRLRLQGDIRSPNFQTLKKSVRRPRPVDLEGKKISLARHESSRRVLGVYDVGLPHGDVGYIVHRPSNQGDMTDIPVASISFQNRVLVWPKETLDLKEAQRQLCDAVLKESH